MRTRTVYKELGHRDEAEDVRREHALDVRLCDLADLLDTEDEASVVD